MTTVTRADQGRSDFTTSATLLPDNTTAAEEEKERASEQELCSCASMLGVNFSDGFAGGGLFFLFSQPFSEETAAYVQDSPLLLGESVGYPFEHV